MKPDDPNTPGQEDFRDPLNLLEGSPGSGGFGGGASGPGLKEIIEEVFEPSPTEPEPQVNDIVEGTKNTPVNEEKESFVDFIKENNSNDLSSREAKDPTIKDIGDIGDIRRTEETPDEIVQAGKGETFKKDNESFVEMIERRNSEPEPNREAIANDFIDRYSEIGTGRTERALEDIVEAGKDEIFKKDGESWVDLVSRNTEEDPSVSKQIDLSTYKEQSKVFDDLEIENVTEVSKEIDLSKYKNQPDDLLKDMVNDKPSEKNSPDLNKIKEPDFEPDIDDDF